jgi:hypothetical protein
MPSSGASGIAIYISTALIPRSRSEHPEGWRIPAGDIEGLALDRLRLFFASRTDVGDALASLNLDARSLEAALRNASALSEGWLAMPSLELRSLVQDSVEQAIIAADRVDIHMNRVKIAAARQVRVQNGRDRDPVVLSIAAKLRRAGKGKRLIIENGAEWRPCGIQPRPRQSDPGGLRDPKPAPLWIARSIEAMSARLGMNTFRLTSLVRLSYLAPGVIRAFLAGRHPIALTPTRLLRLSKDLPHDWREQRRFLGFAA